MTPSRRVLLHGVVCAAALAPALWLVYAAIAGRLGANPIEEITHETGQWALRLLIATLSVTPLRRHLGWRALAPLRRTLGLLAFTYACLHFAIYCVDQLDLAYIVEDVIERPYVTVGFAAFCGLVPLAITSTRGWIRRLGRRWVILHRLVYASAGLAVVHFLWLVKADLVEPLVYAAILGLLGIARIVPSRAGHA